MFSIISLDQKDEWNEIIRSMNRYDFYHLNEYHLLENSGRSLLLYFSSDETRIVLPVVLRRIEGTEYNDITSVYGYAGPLSNRENPDTQAISEFQKHLIFFFEENNIVSAFSRLHPFFENQKLILSDLGEVINTNQTVGIDLSLPVNEQKWQYSSSLKKQLNHFKQKNIIVKNAESREEIDIFIEIYNESMKRVNAPEMYFFSKDYFYTFMENLPSSLFLAYYNDEIISGSLFTMCNGIVQIHLSAVKDKFLHLSPLKLVWDCIRIYSDEQNAKWLHLGGGVGGMDDDLFQFKTRFSDLRFIFKTWRYIHNETVYNRLVSGKYPEKIPQSSYFPIYRF